MSDLIDNHPKLSNNSPELDIKSGEFISRQEAIAEFNCCELTPDGGIDANYAIDFLEQLPSVQPQKGKWIDYSDEGYVECPFCHSTTNCDDNKDELHYCFSCGAELRGEEK